MPLPGSLYTVMWPPDCFMKPNTIERPRPVPLPCSLVVKNGSKMRVRMSGGMPVPESLTSTTT